MSPAVTNQRTKKTSTPQAIRRPRLGFLGVGWIGRNRLEAIARAGVADIICIADPDESSALRAQSWAPGAFMTCAYDDLLSRDPDGVVIATPSAMHAQHALAALETGAAAFCQKPLGRTADEARTITRAAARADRLLSVDFSYRDLEASRRVHQLINDGAIGRVFAADLVFHNAYGPDKPWFYDPGLSGGGCLIDLGVHLIDLALWMLAFPRVETATGRLYAGGRPVREPRRQVEDYATVELLTSDDIGVRIACSWNLPAGCDAIIQARFYGTHGGLEIANVNGSFFEFEARRFHGTHAEVICSPPDWWFGRGAVEWARRLATGDSAYDPAIEHVIDVAEVIDSLYGRDV